MKTQGFTLIELLVSIAIMAVLLAFGLPNYLGARERARDTKTKSEMTQLKSALRMYYNDYQRYPADYHGLSIMGCGVNGDENCPPSIDSNCAAFQFSAGGSDGCSTIYMKKLPVVSFKYWQGENGDTFLACTDSFENVSDQDILASQKRCGYVTQETTAPLGSKFCICSD